MKVKDLIVELQTFDPEALVVTEGIIDPTPYLYLIQ